MTPNDNLPRVYPIIDTHTHFDMPAFDQDRALLLRQAYDRGVRHLVLVGYLYDYFERMYDVKQALDKRFLSPEQAADGSHFSSLDSHVAIGLHPLYITAHRDDHLKEMAKMMAAHRPLAIGEIGLDTFTQSMRSPEVFARQVHFFKAQLDMAVLHKLPVMLHIRKAHAQALAILKAHDYDAHKLGGIAHSFSGGAQEAKAFVRLGFKLGVTGQVTNPNAKKLRCAIRAVVEDYGIDCLVIETDCPDMMPIMCQASDNNAPDKRNVPAHLPWVLFGLSELLELPTDRLAKQLWHNTCCALQVTWEYPLLL